MTTSGSSAAMSVTKSALPSSMTESMMPVGRGVDPRVELVDHLGREALVDQAAVTGVEGWVHVQHEQLLLGQVVGVEVPDERGLLRRREVLVVAGPPGCSRHGRSPPRNRVRHFPPATRPGRSSAGRRTSDVAHPPRRASSRSGRFAEVHGTEVDLTVWHFGCPLRRIGHIVRFSDRMSGLVPCQRSGRAFRLQARRRPLPTRRRPGERFSGIDRSYRPQSIVSGGRDPDSYRLQPIIGQSPRQSRGAIRSSSGKRKRT